MVFGADHVYRMDPSQMLDQHLETGAGVTVAGIRVPRAEAKAFGCIDSDETGRITEFLEKPADPPRCPTTPRSRSRRWATTSSPPTRCWRRCAPTPRTATPTTTWAATSSRAWSGRAKRTSTTSPTTSSPAPPSATRGYWRDVGTIDAYYEAHIDLVSVHPIFNLYNHRWPIRTASAALPPAKFVEGGIAQDSIVGAGTIVSGAIVRRSVISPNVRIEAGAEVSDSVVMPGVRVGRGAVVRGAILDKNVVIPDGALVGVDLATDRARYTVSAGGVAVLGKGITAPVRLQHPDGG